MSSLLCRWLCALIGIMLVGISVICVSIKCIVQPKYLPSRFSELVLYIHIICWSIMWWRGQLSENIFEQYATFNIVTYESVLWSYSGFICLGSSVASHWLSVDVGPFLASYFHLLPDPLYTLWMAFFCFRCHLQQTSMVWFFQTLGLDLLSVGLQNPIFYQMNTQLTSDHSCGLSKAWWTPQWCLLWDTLWTCATYLFMEACTPLLMWLFAWALH